MTSFARMTAEQRSAHMAKIRGRDTHPERVVQSLLYASGVRFKSHVQALPGTPDIVVDSRRTIVFIHGCFWHRHGCRRGATKIKKNREFWNRKFAANVARDRRAASALRDLGWRVMTVWECETVKGLGRLIPRLLKRLAPDRRICHDGPHVALPGRALCADCLARTKGGPTRPSRRDSSCLERRRSLGLCKCGMPLPEGRRICFACSSNRASAAWFQKRYVQWLSEGRCRCGNRLAQGKARCAGCLRRLRADAKARYARRKTSGLCADPGCPRPARKGHTRCEPCLKRVRKYSASYARDKRAKGLCGCGKAPRRGFKTCRRCSGRRRPYDAQLYARKKAAGRCTRSGCWRKAFNKGALCRYHRDQANRRQRLARS